VTETGLLYAISLPPTNQMFLARKGTISLTFSIHVGHHSVSETDTCSTCENSYGAFA